MMDARGVVAGDGAVPAERQRVVVLVDLAQLRVVELFRREAVLLVDAITYAFSKKTVTEMRSAKRTDPVRFLGRLKLFLNSSLKKVRNKLGTI